MYFDVDGLKRANDEKGHAEGDKLLVAVADVLRAAFREHDVVARLGGDEFAAMALLGRDRDELLDRQAIELRLQDALRAKRAELGGDYELSVSFGSMVANHSELDRDRRIAGARRPAHVHASSAPAGGSQTPWESCGAIPERGAGRLPAGPSRTGHPRACR